MKNLKKILSVLALIVLVGSDFLTSISYALEDGLEDSVVVQTESEEETENVENEEGKIDEEDSEDAYKGESIEEEDEAGETVESTTGDIVEEGTGEVSEVGSGEIEELTEETVEGDTGVIVEELIGEIVESTGTGEDNIIEDIKYNEEVIIGEKTYNDVTVRVEALTGIFPEGTELVIEPVKSWDLSSLKDKLVEEKEEIKKDTTIVAFDITFKYEGEEVQPKEGEKVKVTFDYSRNEDLVKADKNKNQEVKVYHLEDKDEEGNKVALGEEKVVDVTNKEESTESGIAVADADSFSIYVVTYGNEDPEFSATLIGDDSARNDFHYKTITISDGTHTYTLMDRNLGARVAWDPSAEGNGFYDDNSENYDTASDYYGYYYQWGNNWGFSAKTTSVGATSQVTVPDSDTPSKYSNSNWNSYKPWSVQNNLWGNVTNTEEARKGPCPTGWHVPSLDEWVAIRDAWCVSAGKGEKYCTACGKGEGCIAGQEFAEALQMPTAGNRSHSNLDSNYRGEFGLYWSSTPNDYEFYAYRLYFESYRIVTPSSDCRSYGYPIRCLKNNVKTIYNSVELTDDNTTTTVGSDEVVNGLPIIMTVTENTISEVDGEKLAGELNIDFGGKDAKFSRLVKVKIPVEGSSKAYVKVKHVGSDEYNFDGLTSNIEASCDNGDIVNTDDMYTGAYLNVEDGYVSIYTCEASSFAAFGLPKVTFEPENGSGATVVEVESGATVNSGDIPTVTKDGYDFSGWYLTGAESAFDFSGTAITGDITLYARWQEGEGVMYTVTFDANRGTFVDGVIPNTPTPKSQSISDGTLITQAPTVEFPGYNLTGWWTEPRGGIQWDFANDIVTGNITLYAHWMYGEEYGDLDIYIWKNESTTGHYTFMDRNLGATELYDKVYCNKDDGNSCTTRRDYDSYGYYYQQGNNYGFDSYAENHGALSNGRTGSLNMSSYSWSNPYISSTFAGVGVENWTTNTNLWGGSQSDPSRKQGPCPDGYHVPNQSERTTIRNTWNAGNTRNIIGSIDKDFLMPAASYRQRANTEVLVSDLHHFRYLSSTYRYIFGDENNANLTRIMKIYQEKISNGFSVRCIKDVKNEGSSAILTGIELNGGEKAIISIAEGKIQSLQAPTKAGYVFSGWYTTSDYQTGTKVVEDSQIVVPTALYAYWDINKYDVNASVATGDEDKGYLSGMGSTGISLTGLYDYGTELVFIAIPELGYVFDYWMNGDQVLSGTDLGDGRNQLTIVVDQVLNIIAFFKSPTPYTVEHYKQNLDQTGYDFVWSGIMYGTANEQTNATGTNYEGFTLSGNLSNYQTGIKADGSTVVRLYYNRNVYTVTFENRNGYVLWSGKVAYGTTPIYSGAQPLRPSTEQVEYTFDGWYPELSSATMDTTYTATYTELPRLYTVTLTGTPAGYGTLSPESLSKEYETAIVVSGDQLTIGGTEVILTGNEGYEFQEWTGNCGHPTKQVCDELIIYSHPDPIEFTGNSNLIITNPGYDLFSESNYKKDFEISFDIVDQDLSHGENQATILNVKDEDDGDVWPGFAFRKLSEKNKLEFTARGNKGATSTSIQYNFSDVHSVKISRINSVVYISVNGGENRQLFNYSGFNRYFDKPITIGSSYKDSDHLFRPAKVTLSNILIKRVDRCYTGNVYVVTGDCQMTAEFKEIENHPDVTVNHHWMNIGGSGYTIHETQHFSGNIGDEFTAQEKIYTGFDAAQNNEKTIIISGDNSSNIIDLYYDRQWGWFHFLPDPFDSMFGVITSGCNNNMCWYGEDIQLTVVENTGYRFNSWGEPYGITLPEGVDRTKKTISFTMPEITTLYQIRWGLSFSAIPYTITYHLNGGEEITPNQTGYTVQNAIIQVTDPIMTGHEFLGWTGGVINGPQLSGPTTGLVIIVSDMGNVEVGDREYYANWTPSKYAVTGSIAAGQENMGYLSGATSTGTSLTGLYEYGTELIFIAVPELGYLFDYWEVNGNTELPDGATTGENQLNIIVNQILDIIAHFKPSNHTPYTVEHYKQNVGQTGYDFEWSGTMYGTTNASTNATGTDYEGFTLSGNLVDYQTGINADGSTVIRLYYDRNVYTITWNNWNGSGITTTPAVYGAHPEFARDGWPQRYRADDEVQYLFIFTGWSRSGSSEIIRELTGLTTEIVTGDTTYIAQYDQTYRSFEVRYHPNEGTGNMENQTFQLYTSGALSLNNFIRTGYEFDGWLYYYADDATGFYENGQTINVEKDYVKGDRERELGLLYFDLYAQWKPSTDTKFTVNCYTRELDKNYKVLSPDPKYLTGKQYTGKTDSGIRIGDYRAECLVDGYDIGHGFSGAILYGSDLPSGGVETGDGGNTTILADETRRIDVYIAPKLDRFVINISENCGYKGDPSGDYYYGSKIYLEANPFECYSFSGWIGSGLPDGFDRLSSTTTFFMPHVSVLTVTPTVRENTYNIIFSGNGSTSGIMSNLSVLCTSGTLSQNAFEREGYTFAGWSENPSGPVQFMNKGDVHKLSTESGGSVTLYAVWDINSYDVTGSVVVGQENMGYLSGATSTGTSLTGLYEYGTELIFIAVPELGYLFDYWEVNNGTGDNLPDGVVASGNQLTVIVDQILDIIVHFKADVRTVTVNHYQMNIGGGYTLFETEGDFTGYVGSGFTAIEKEYSGFIASESNVKTITISGNEESNVINLYYNRESYNLRYYVDGIQTGNIEPYYFGQSISPRQKPTKEGYTFSGWDDVPSTMPAEDVNIYGSFITNKHWVRFYDDHNGNLILSGEYDYGTPGSSIITPNGSGLSKTGNTFSGWVGIPDYMPDYDVDVEAYWDLNFYTIRIKDTSGAVIKSGTYGYGLEVPLECPGMEWEREGYMMTGCTSSMIPEFMPDHDMDIIVRWLPIERNIEVRYHAMDTNGQYPREWSGIYYTGLTESVFRVPDYTTSGFSQDRENYPYQPTSLVVSGNESANVVDVYYKREKYWLDIHGISRLLPEIDSRVTFAEVIPNKGEFGKQYYFGEEITVNLLLNEGWNFTGWYDATDENMGFPPEEVSDLTSRNISFHMPAHDVKVEPLMEHIPYILSFTGYEGANISEYYPGVENQEVYYGYRAYLPFLEKDGYSFFGWKNEYGNYEWHTGDGYPSEPTLQSMPSHDYELIAVFLPRTDMPYRKDYYLQDIDGMGYTLNEDLREGDTNGVTDEPLPGRDDYKNIDGFQYTGFGYDENFLPIDQWPNIKATGDNYINYYYDRKIDSVYVEYDAKKMSILGTGEYRYGAPVTLTATVKTGYEFSGFTSDQGELLTSGSVYNFTMPDSYVYLYANADSIVYSIEYEMYGGWLTPYQWYKTGYTVDGDFDLDIFDAVKDGYVFLGWTGGEIGVRELTEPTTGLIIPLGSTGNRKYFANFEATGSNITVNYYLKKIDPENNVLTGGSYVYKESVIYTGLTDSVVDIQSFYGTGIEGYEYTTAIVYGSDLSGGVETGTTTILGDQSRVIDIYYTPKKYDFTVIQGQDSTISGTSISTGYYLGAYVTLSGDSTDSCFEWDKWGSSSWPEGVENESHTTFAMPAHNVTVESMVKEKSYNITFNANGGIGTMEVLPVQCTSGTLIANNFERDGYTFTGWSENPNGPVQFTNEGDVHRLSTQSGGSVTLFAIWDVNHYTVTFDLSGGSLTGDMTLTKDYTIETPSISLIGYEPVRKGYTFTGWYKGDNLVNSIAGGETGDYTLIAKWEGERRPVPVVVFMKKLIPGEYSEYDSQLMWGGGIVGELYTAPIENFIPTGFYYEEDNENNVRTVTVSPNVDNEVWLFFSRIPYPVIVHNPGEGISNQTTGGRDYLYEEPVTISINPFTGWEFNGWAKIQGDLDGVDLSQKTLSFNMPAGQIQISPILSHISYTVSFDSASGTAVEESQTYYYNDNLSGLDNAVTTRTGYNFDGWYLSGVLYTSGSIMPAENIILTAKWTPRTGIQYQVNHRGENTGDNNYEVLLSGYIMYGTSDTQTIAESENFAGFTLSGDVEQEIIDPNGTTVVDIYYNRNVYGIVLDNNGGIGVTELTGKYQAPLIVPNPTKSGYEFAGWNPELPMTIPNYDYTGIAMWNPSTGEYKVEFYYQLSDGTYPSIATSGESRMGTTEGIGSVKDVDKEPTMSGYAFDSTNTGNVLEGEIVGDGSLVLKVYFKKQFTVRYLTGSHGIFSEDIHTDLDYGIGTPVFRGNTGSHDSGYTFNGRFPEWTGIVTNDVEYEAQWIANTDTEFKVEYYLQNVEDDEYTFVETGVQTGTTNTTGYADITKEFTGFIFSGGNQNNVTSGLIAGDGSLVLKLYYDRKEYNVTTGEVEHGTMEGGTGNQRYGKRIIFTAHPDAGYVISKWLRDGNEILSGGVIWTGEELEIKVDTGMEISVEFEARNDTPYYVEYYKENLDGGYDVWTGTYSGTTDQEATAQELTFTGFTYDSGNVDNITTGNIDGDGSRVLKLYYNREIYTITWLNEDGTDMDTTTVKYGEVPTHAVPIQPADAHYTYEFAGWDPEPTAATGGVSYRATYNYIVNKYTITWRNDDGILIDTTEVEYGVVPTHANPRKADTEDYRYTFVGWTPNLVAVVGDAEYTATFTAEEKEKPSKGGNMSGGGGRKSNTDDSDNKHGSAEENSDGFTGDVDNNTGNVDGETLSLYQWARENDITTMDTLEEANPEGLLTRGHMAKMVVNFVENVLGKPVPTIYPDKCNWKDKESERESQEIKIYAKKACSLGLMGIYVEEFMPNKILDRAEFGTIVSRLLWGDRYNILDTDHRSYYEDHLWALKRQGILTQTDNPEDRWEIRKWVWLVFRRISEKLNK